MKAFQPLLTLAAVVLSGFPIAAAEPPPADLQLRFVEVAEAFDSIREQLGPAAASAVVSLDLRTNTLRLAIDHPDAAKVRGIVGKLDVRPAQAQVAATIKRIIPATSTSEGREEVLARTTVIGPYGKPIIVTVGDEKQGTLQIELEVTPIPGAPK